MGLNIQIEIERERDALKVRVHELTEALVRAHATMDTAMRAIKHQVNELHSGAADAYRAWDKKTGQ